MRTLVCGITVLLLALTGWVMAAASQDQRAVAQFDERSGVFVSYASEPDQVGKLFTLEVREAIRRSAGYRLVETWADADLGVVVMSIDHASPRQPCLRVGQLSVVSISYTAKLAGGAPMLMDSAIAMVGRDAAASSARNVLAGIDRVAASINSR